LFKNAPGVFVPVGGPLSSSARVPCVLSLFVAVKFTLILIEQ